MTPCQCPTSYNLTLFDITLNELIPRLKDKFPCTDSSSTPDKRHLEYGEYDQMLKSHNLNRNIGRLTNCKRRDSNFICSEWSPTKVFQVDTNYIMGFRFF